MIGPNDNWTNREWPFWQWTMSDELNRNGTNSKMTKWGWTKLRS